ncbi:MAG: hypothetical protein NTW03_10550 [Verrucomicrobia bacterium]|nr:hypothetical protein [Verrucomicrobiota bacterium]
MNRQMSFMWKLLAGFCLAVAARAGEAPQIFWMSDPVRPGETLVLQGANFRTNTRVEIRPATALAGVWTGAEVLQRTEDNLKAVMPADWPMCAFACRAVTPGETVGSPVSWVNVPDVWWLQGDAGEAASPGGWLRVLGRNLNFGGHSTARLGGETNGGSDETNGGVTLAAKEAGCYSLSFALPLALKPGRYQVQVDNGLAGAAPWRGEVLIQAPPAWPTNVFSVVESLGQDAAKERRKSLVKYREGKDCTAGVLAALRKAKENGGGVLY